jgi:hypothetical protein
MMKNWAVQIFLTVCLVTMMATCAAHGSSAASAVSAPHKEDPVPSVEKRKPKAFYAWNGKKRSDKENDADIHGQSGVEKRRPKAFYAWNGRKRSKLQYSNRRMHYGYGGMSSSKYNDILGNYYRGRREENKRKPKSFYAWNGKRSGSGLTEIPAASDDKRGGPKSFYAWNGKRSAGSEHREESGGNKRGAKSFYAWNGKRGNDKRRPKAFYAWNGKRSLNDGEAEEPVGSVDKRQPKSFYAWNGKRGGPKSFYAWNGK